MVTISMNDELIRPVKGDNTPGADGMSGNLYQVYWDIVGAQVVSEVQKFLLYMQIRVMTIYNILFHVRDAFLPMVNCISVELHCILWCLRSLHDIHMDSCEIWSDCSTVVLAVAAPLEWPKYLS